MFEIIFLGTSASAPSVHRSLPAQVVKHDEYRFLLDCGEGTQRQILQSGIGFKNLNQILITHGHLDHILGLAGLLSTLMRWETIEVLDIYGSRNALERIHDLLYGVVLRGAQAPMPLNLHIISPGTFFERGDFNISAFNVNHRGSDSLGYVFQEKGRRPFLAEKAEALGVPPGPWRRDLVEGRAVTLPDGRTIEPDAVLGDFKEGTRLVMIGDTGETESLVPVCRDADAIVVESTYLDHEADMARQFGHLTARRAAELAVQAQAKRLILTHISRRYRERDVLQEAQAYFPSTAVARDFDTYQVKRDD
ncbi:MAG: ribonuclease Z [Anaerolineae bacterium]|nr:ribonuclease Z [Anaerolineae bacterium]